MAGAAARIAAAHPALDEATAYVLGLLHGLNDTTLPRWRALFDLLARFDAAVGGAVYALLPDITVTTFGRANLPTPYRPGGVA